MYSYVFIGFYSCFIISSDRIEIKRLKKNIKQNKLLQKNSGKIRQNLMCINIIAVI